MSPRINVNSSKMHEITLRESNIEQEETDMYTQKSEIRNVHDKYQINNSLPTQKSGDYVSEIANVDGFADSIFRGVQKEEVKPS